MSPEGPVGVNRREGEVFSDKKDSMSNCSDHEIMADQGRTPPPYNMAGAKSSSRKMEGKGARAGASKA